jgi:hypothetical protein
MITYVRKVPPITDLALQTPDRFLRQMHSGPSPSDLVATHAASATTRPGRNCQGGGVCEIRIGPAVGRAARCGSVTLLVAGEPAIACASIVVALQAIRILASGDRGYASCEDGRRRREGKNESTHVLSPTLQVPQLTVGPSVRG